MNNGERLWKAARCGFIERSRAMKPVTMTIQKACEYSGLSKSTIYNLVNARKLTVIKVGKRTLVTISSLDALLTAPESVDA